MIVFKGLNKHFLFGLIPFVLVALFTLDLSAPEISQQSSYVFNHPASGPILAQISLPDHQKIVIEDMIEDGVVSFIHYGINVRSQSYQIAAIKAQDYYSFAHCPSLKNCWVFFLNGPLIEPYQLNAENIIKKMTLWNSLKTRFIQKI